MTPQEAVSAFFNTMRSETDQAGLMYSQFAVVQALDYVIDRWEDLNPLARDKAGNRTREWLEHLVLFPQQPSLQVGFLPC